MELEATPRQSIERAAAAPVERQEAARFAGSRAGDLARHRLALWLVERASSALRQDAHDVAFGDDAGKSSRAHHPRNPRRTAGAAVLDLHLDDQFHESCQLS